MVTLDWELDRADGVTLVSLFVESSRPCRVRIENRLDGPVWPPRERGQPAAGWDDDCYAGVVPADGRLTVGYSTAASPAEPPAEIVSTDPVDAAEADDAGAGAVPAGTDRGVRTTDPERTAKTNGHADGEIAPDVEATSSGVIRSLGDPIVPRDCVPIPAEDGDTGGRGGGARETDRPRSRSLSPGSPDRCSDADRDPSERSAREPPAPPTVAPQDADDPGRRRSRTPRTGPTGDALVVPGAVRAWLRDVERRLDAVEEAAAAGATGSENGSHATGDPDESAAERSDLTTAVAADRRALAWLARRVDALAARADAVDGVR